MYTIVTAAILGYLAGKESAKNEKAPVQIKCWMHERTINPRGITSVVPAHWEYPIIKRVSDTCWHLLFENIPRDKNIPCSDDYTSPMVLVHDGGQRWNKDSSHAWIIAIMQMDGGSICDVYVTKTDGADLLLFGNVKNPYYHTTHDIDGAVYIKRADMFPKAVLIDKQTLEITPW